MFDPKPPVPRALPDDQLNAKIAELQSQPEGLMAAMAFIEEQSKLRQEDALELSKWQLESQMYAATKSADAEPEEQTLVSTPTPREAVSESTPRSEPAPVDYISDQAPPAPAAQEVPQASTAESINDIVAALNASYAAAATEPQKPEPVIAHMVVSETSITEKVDEAGDTEVLVTTSTFEGDLQLEKPTTASPVQAFPPTKSVEVLEESAEDDSQSGPTRTAGALVWSWLSIASTPLVLVLAALLKSAGSSLAQSAVVISLTVIFASLLASVGAVASAKGTSSLTYISRAAFGVWGNAVPALALFLVRLVWLSAFVYFSSRVVSPIIFNQPWFAAIAERLVFPAEFTASLFVIVPLMLIAASIAALGGEVLLRSQQVTAVLSVLGVGTFIYFIARNYSVQDLAQGDALSTGSILDIALFVAAVTSLVIFAASGDFARKLPQETPSAKVFFLSFVSTLFLPLIAGIAGVLWLYMAEPNLAASFESEIFATIASQAPIWVFVVFVVAVGLSFMQLISSSMYSMAGNILALVRMPNWTTYVLSFVFSISLTLTASYFVSATELQQLIVEILLISGVVAAAWTGMFVADALARRRRYHEVSLTREYGFYGKFNLTNLAGFLVALGLGFGYLNGTGRLSSWAGYLGDLTPGIYELAGSNIGIAMAFGFASLFPVLFGIPRIRKQEQNLAELDQRREELKEFLEQVQ